MVALQKLVHITLIVHHRLVERVHEICQHFAFSLVLTQHARSGVLKQDRFLHQYNKLQTERMDVFHLYVACEVEQAVLSYIIRELDLMVSGRGSVLSEFVDIFTAMPLPTMILTVEDSAYSTVLNDQMRCINVVVGRGEAEMLMRALLRMGYLSPFVVFGTGTGIREQLGLVRVAIPKEKEVLSLIVYHQDTSEVVEYIRQEAHLNVPGKGFISHYPVHYAKLNNKTHNDISASLASTEQIISAIDELSGNIEWRRKSIKTLKIKPQVINELKRMTLISPKDKSDAVANIAFSAGATGATVSYVSLKNYSHLQNMTNKEYVMCTFVVNDKIMQAILDEVEKQNLHSHVMLQIQEVALN